MSWNDCIYLGILLAMVVCAAGFMFYPWQRRRHEEHFPMPDDDEKRADEAEAVSKIDDNMRALIESAVAARPRFVRKQQEPVAGAAIVLDFGKVEADSYREARGAARRSFKLGARLPNDARNILVTTSDDEAALEDIYVTELNVATCPCIKLSMPLRAFQHFFENRAFDVPACGAMMEVVMVIENRGTKPFSVQIAFVPLEVVW